MNIETDAPMCIHWRNGLPFAKSTLPNALVCPTCHPELVA